MSEALEEAAVDQRDGRDPEATARTRELFGLVAGLPRHQREAVAAVDIAGMSYRQAAATLGVPIGTVMSRLARGRSRLARALEPDAGRRTPSRCAAAPRRRGTEARSAADAVAARRPC